MESRDEEPARVGISQHAKWALALFACMVIFTRIARYTATSQGAIALMLEVIAILCAFAIFVAFYFRARAAKNSVHKPLSTWKWIVLSVVTVLYLSEPVAFIIACLSVTC